MRSAMVKIKCFSGAAQTLQQIAVILQDRSNLRMLRGMEIIGKLQCLSKANFGLSPFLLGV